LLWDEGESVVLYQNASGRWSFIFCCVSAVPRAALVGRAVLTRLGRPHFCFRPRKRVLVLSSEGHLRSPLPKSRSHPDLPVTTTQHNTTPRSTPQSAITLWWLTKLRPELLWHRPLGVAPDRRNPMIAASALQSQTQPAPGTKLARGGGNLSPQCRYRRPPSVLETPSWACARNSTAQDGRWPLQRSTMVPSKQHCNPTKDDPNRTPLPTPGGRGGRKSRQGQLPPGSPKSLCCLVFLGAYKLRPRWWSLATPPLGGGPGKENVRNGLHVLLWKPSVRRCAPPPMTDKKGFARTAPPRQNLVLSFVTFRLCLARP